MCLFQLAAERVDPQSAVPGDYLAGYHGSTVTVSGPARVYPSGLPYYTLLDRGPAGYIFAGDLEWVAPLPVTDRIVRAVKRAWPATPTARAA
ncbi:hypothetical protein ONR57_16265 [Hoyosella sp. YIM 151337]|uniref:hypothetical protein n=1 Tax=Hoyosella sp. YIM 151337 TaxID=2992742 RepID=UPI002236A490|nr:hypothetical protein [Hoyosella sp. YIM 151337]MCW4354861.1 hypothetical protein [Hoyosella sp. YIM 151337]